jgi:hypothetical protein
VTGFHQSAAVGNPQAGHRTGRKRVARSQRGPGNRVPVGCPPIRRQGRELAYPRTGVQPARSTRDRYHGRKTGPRDSGGAFGCALRRSELASLESRHIQQRDGRWVFVDLVGKGKRVRTVPIPPFVKVAIDAWTPAAALSDGALFRRVRRREYPEKTPAVLRERMIWHIVTKYARQPDSSISLPPMTSGGPGRNYARTPWGPRADLVPVDRALSVIAAVNNRLGLRRPVVHSSWSNKLAARSVKLCVS